uniref:Flavoprotein pyridine nucleotide cytochrome reductase-like FAD-binding domain-containing protein n=1 Tax=Odontella aurita TaxID=265563 RepID=A0A7S4MUX1_9STRA
MADNKSSSSSNNRAETESVIYICQSGTCRSKGSDAALVEIEELASSLRELDDSAAVCEVKSTGCLGYCRQGPAVSATVATKKKRNKHDSGGHSGGNYRRLTKIYTRVDTLERSAAIVEEATGGKLPPLNRLPGKRQFRLSQIRATKRREFLVSTCQWNKAMSNCIAAAAALETNDTNCSNADIDQVRREMKSILVKAGYPRASPLHLMIPSPASAFDSGDSSVARGEQGLFRKMPTAPIEGYVLWTLDRVRVASPHSATFSFHTEDVKRGTPHPRGRGKLPKPITWHVTMLGEVGSNMEGPLPWVERDYTPVSTALDWERGRCDILIKVYSDGHLTSWLKQRTSKMTALSSEQLIRQDLIRGHGGSASEAVLPPKTAMKVWLSRPIPTLSVPSLALAASNDNDDIGSPGSILLLLAGTGIVALPQILAHREPIRMLGISTPRRNHLSCPIDLIHSCREDDILMLPEIKEYCVQGLRPQHPKFCGLRNYTLLPSSRGSNNSSNTDPLPVTSPPPPFKNFFENEGNDADARINIKKCYDAAGLLQDVSNASINISQRLDENILFEAIGKLIEPFRVVVSGPDAYNIAARKHLVDDCGVDPTQVTILSA